MSGQPSAIQVLTDYYVAFSTTDVATFLPYFYEPSTLIGPQGVLAAPTREVLATIFTPTMEALRARGFSRSEFRVRQARTLSETAELFTGIATRFKKDGQELERVGFTYIMHKSAIGWKIAVVVLHDANADAGDALRGG